MNTRLLRKIKRLILAEPRRMSSWFYPNQTRSGPPCGTVGCIAGWAILLKGKTMGERLRCVIDKDFDIQRKAQIHLGLAAAQARRLFHANYHYGKGAYTNWPRDWAYHIAHKPADKAKVVAKRINRFIRAKGRE